MSPTHAPTPCLEVGCFNLATHKGRCPSCQLQAPTRTAYDHQRGSARERGYGRAWERRRRRHLQVEPFCRTCGGPGKEVDHVIPHRGAQWLFDLEGNLQTLCQVDHTRKTMRERTIPIGIMYPLDLPEAPHARPTRLLCGPAPMSVTIEGDKWLMVTSDGDAPPTEALKRELTNETDVLLLLAIPAPRTAERAFWSWVMDCEAELVAPPLEWVVDGHPKGWWADYMVDQKAEEAMSRRG